MGWVKRAEEIDDGHRCAAPEGEHTEGDLWRCDDCGQLWAWADGMWCWANRWQHFVAGFLELFESTSGEDRR